MAERYFIVTPVPLGTKAPNSQGLMFPVYLAGETELKWSGKMTLPVIGSEVLVTMNKLGPGEVIGYCASHDWLGLMVKLENPPEWWKKQRGRMIEESARAAKIGPQQAALERLRVWPQWILDGVSVVFGAEIESGAQLVAEKS